MVELIPKEQLEAMICKMCLKDVSNPTDRKPHRVLGENGYDPDLCNDCWDVLNDIGPKHTLALLRLGASVAARDYQDKIRKLEGELAVALGEEEA